VPGLWISSLVFFLVNIWILSIIISDVGESKSVMQRFNNQKPM
jgi:phosphatidylinositol glycan class M